MKTNLGKVAITPKGTWNSTTAYTALDTVNFGGGSWLAKRGNIAVTPTEGDDWMQLSAKGADAELTKDGIVSALGYTPERDYGNYELIETITLTEDTTQIIRTQEPDGTAYNFKSMIVKAELLPAKDANLAFFTKFFCNDVGMSACSSYATSTTATTYAFQRAVIDNGVISVYASQGSPYESYTQAVYGGYYTGVPTMMHAINNIKIWLTGYEQFSINSAIHIYAVRAT